jgi:copper homeostasis protein
MNDKKKLLEICCYSLYSCKNAERGGADRIELCGGFLEGGTSPSIGLVKEVLGQIGIPVFIMVRPRGGDFCYSEDEILTMIADIEIMKEYKPAGFVFGLLREDGNIDIKNTSRLIKVASPLPITFHRAFDRCVNPEKGLEELISLGIQNVLTSGQYNFALDGFNNLTKWVKLAKGRIQIMAGSGVNPENIEKIAETNVNAFHFSAKKAFESKMIRTQNTIFMGGEGINEFQNFEADFELIIQAKTIIEKLEKM